MTYASPLVAPPCAVIIGKRFADGGQPCGHAVEDHEKHQDGAFIYYVCRPCRGGGLPWSEELNNRVAGADHWFADGYGGRRTPKSEEVRR